MSHKFSTDLQFQVRERAGYLCEYCHANESWQHVRFTIDYVIPLDAGGTDDIGNLCLACFPCNRRKSNRLEVNDNLTGIVVPLFNPRKDKWPAHFIWSNNGMRVLPLTATGRATIELLQFNLARVQLIREADVMVNRHPPTNDPVVAS